MLLSPDDKVQSVIFSAIEKKLEMDAAANWKIILTTREKLESLVV